MWSTKLKSISRILTCKIFSVSEVIGTKHRYILIVTSFGWQIGEFVLLSMAYFLRDWRHLQIAASVPTILLLSCFWYGIFEILISFYNILCISKNILIITRVSLESPKWLISQGRYVEARETIQIFAKWQGKKVPDELLEMPDTLHPKQDKLTPLHLFKTFVIRKRIILISIIW